VGRDGADYCGDLPREETEIFFESGLDSQITDLPPVQLSDDQQRLSPVARMSAATCGFAEGPGYRFAHPGYAFEDLRL